jgi:HSP20 family molecular chaperone IbpA
MIFTPLTTRHATRAPRPSDVALQRFLLGTLAGPAAARLTDYTVTQDDKATTLQLDVPGLAREQLQITLEGKRVVLKSIEGAPRHVHRAWELQDDIDTATSTARLENGVLTLTLAKQPPAAKAVEIVVH